MKCFLHLDMDGRCAGSVVAQFTQNYKQEDYYEVDYIKPLPIDIIKPNEEIYLVDYSFKEDTIWQFDEILKKTKNVVWVDHHTSSINLLKVRPDLKKIKGIIQDGISGAALTYMYLYNCDFENIPYYIKLVSDYDCWLYKYNPDTTYFKIGMDMEKQGPLEYVWKQLYKESDKEYLEENSGLIIDCLINKGKIIKDYIDKDNESYREQWSYESEIDGYRCLVINRKSNSWIFGKKYYEYPVVVVWAFNGDKYSYSIFSNDKTVDCSKIAEKLGGGGHVGAAGFTSNELLFKKKGEI